VAFFLSTKQKNNSLARIGVACYSTGMEKFNPLDDFENLIEASTYDYDRINKFRLHFECSGKQGTYLVILEWNDDVNIMKCSLVIDTRMILDSDIIEKSLLNANESAWHGFFILDGVGNTIYKMLIDLSNDTHEKSMFMIEDSIDKAVLEADRFSISCALTHNKNLFPDEVDELETLNLMFSDVKGSA